jgi:phenylacetate-coenzyme A ligase PaaK-like adenylate-forming protein
MRSSTRWPPRCAADADGPRASAGMGPDTCRESDALHGRARAMVRAFERGAHPPESFDALAIDLARFQAAHVPGYARLCAARGVDPSAFERASDAPAVPADAFKLASVFCFEDRAATVIFRTSGTTVGARGTHAMRDVRTYDAAALAFGRAMFARDLAAPVPVLVIGPPEAEAPDSSLAHMCGLFARAFGVTEPLDRTFFIRQGTLMVDDLRARLAALGRADPVAILATSFALVHLTDVLGSDVLALPPRSRVMQTGGFKGRSREVVADDLRRAVARAFAVDERAVVSEYGMTELSSQLWEATLVDERARPGIYVEPPWLRVVAVDPESLAPLPDGTTGIARIEDLANVDSAFAVLVQDRVRRVEGGIELLGRAPGAPPRGCSIALDEMLGAREGAP